MTTGPNDEKFLGGIPGRFPGTQALKAPAAKEPTIADKIAKKAEEIAEGRLMAQVIADASGTSNRGGGGGESVTATIVTKAMDVQEKLFGMVQDEKVKSDALKAKADEDRGKAMEQYHDEREKTLTRLVETVNETLKTVQAGGSPKSADTILGQVETVMGWLQARTPPDTTPKPQSGVSDALQIQLLNSKQAHELEMKKLDVQIAEITTKFNFELKKFDEEAKSRWHQWEAGQKTREKGLEGFQDLAGAIAAGIRGERNGSAAVEHEAPAGAEAVQAAISSFPCQFCKTPVKIKPGELKAVCDNPVCKAEYDIKSA